jgi:hypothetical protein
MKHALGAKMKLDFIDYTLPVPADAFDPSFRAWNRCNQLVSSWLLNFVSTSIANSIVFFENAIDIWNELRERFSQGDLIRISELQQEIYALQQDSRSVIQFYSDLKVLWEELELYFLFRRVLAGIVVHVKLCVWLAAITLFSTRFDFSLV